MRWLNILYFWTAIRKVKMCAASSVWNSFFLINSVYQCHSHPIYFSSNMFCCSFSKKNMRVTLHKHVFPLVSSKKHAGHSCISMFSCWFPQKTCRQLLHNHVFPLASRKNMTTTLAQSCLTARFPKKHAGHSCTIMFSHSLPQKTCRPLLHKHVFMLISDKNMMIPP